MRNLILMRHAKAEPATSTDDHARPLTRRGRAEAAEAGERIAALARPDLILASDSLRTRQTVDRVAPAFATAPARRLARGLYGASADAALDEIRAAPEDVGCLLVIGHNPGLSELARRLAATGEVDALARLGDGFPTSCFAVLAFPADRWRDVGDGGRLLFLLPRDERAGPRRP